MTSSRGVT